MWAKFGKNQLTIKTRCEHNLAKIGWLSKQMWAQFGKQISWLSKQMWAQFGKNHLIIKKCEP